MNFYHVAHFNTRQNRMHAQLSTVWPRAILKIVETKTGEYRVSTMHETHCGDNKVVLSKLSTSCGLILLPVLMYFQGIMAKDKISR